MCKYTTCSYNLLELIVINVLVLINPIVVGCGRIILCCNLTVLYLPKQKNVTNKQETML